MLHAPLGFPSWSRENDGTTATADLLQFVLVFVAVPYLGPPPPEGTSCIRPGASGVPVIHTWLGLLLWIYLRPPALIF